ncbi:MAG: acetamidase/formamidase family protein [Candidatus Eremiobacterota bacterium]
MTFHRLEPGPGTLHGSWSDRRAPCLWVDSGDTVSLRTLDVSWGLEPPTRVDRPRARFEPREDGPCLTGPVGIRGAEPGMTLEVRLRGVRPGPYGFTYAGGDRWFNAELNRRAGVAHLPFELVRWDISDAARSDCGWEVPLRPFPGTLGLSPPGEHSGWFPSSCGGNMDCRELIGGAVLYLPVQVPGALLSAGDGHAAQGDGELCGMAVECPLEALDLELVLHEDWPVASPHLRTAAEWITLGFGEDLDDAVAMALNAMLDLLVVRLELTRPRALALLSVRGDMRVTQLVNRVRGVHCAVPLGMLEPCGPGPGRLP